MFQVINERFLERCQKYRNCPESWEPPVFVCQQQTCVSRRETLNCKLEGECVNMEAQFLCDNGLCHNVSRVMSCQYSQVRRVMTMSDVRAEYHLQVGETYDCTDKRNCIMLTGLYQCSRGQCTEVRQGDKSLRFFFSLTLPCPECIAWSLSGQSQSAPGPG